MNRVHSGSYYCSFIGIIVVVASVVVFHFVAVTGDVITVITVVVIVVIFFFSKVIRISVIVQTLRYWSNDAEKTYRTRFPRLANLTASWNGGNSTRKLFARPMVMTSLILQALSGWVWLVRSSWDHSCLSSG